MPQTIKPQPQIALHIGAHKTATTHLQRSVQAHRAALRGQGVAYFGPLQLRGDKPSLGQRLSLFEQSGKGDPKGALAGMLRRATRLVVSEENFTGGLQPLRGQISTPLYPGAESRLTALAAAIAPDGIDVFLGVRHPARFLTSVYGQMLLGGARLSVADFRAANPPFSVDWADYVKRLMQTPGVKSVTVWRYEDYGPLFTQIVDAMIGPNTGVTPLPDIMHRGLSVAAVKQIQDAFARAEDGEVAVRARKAYPVGPENPAFAVYGRITSAVSGLRYARQVRQIAAVPGVTFLRP